jgi:hypothetical protein
MAATKHRREPAIHIPKPPKYNIQIFPRASRPSIRAAMASDAGGNF